MPEVKAGAIITLTKPLVRTILDDGDPVTLARAGCRVEVLRAVQQSWLVRVIDAPHTEAIVSTDELQ